MKQSAAIRVVSILLAFLLTAVCLAGCTAEQQSSEPVTEEPTLENWEGESSVSPLFWTVTSEKYSGTVFLLGSIHAAENNSFPLPEAVREAFSQSEAVAVECDTLSYETDTAAQMAGMRQMVYLDGSTVAEHLSAETYSEAVELLIKLGLYQPGYDIYKPTFWTALLDGEVLTRSGLSYDYGIDINLMKAARQTGKELIEVESVEYQYSILTGFSDGLYELLLQSYLGENALDEQADMMEQLYQVWASGDAEALCKLALTDSTEDSLTSEQQELYDEYNSTMLTERNNRMTDAAESYIRQGKTVFMTVGAAHMMGEDGIVSQLRQRGYTVTESENRY